MLDCPVFLIPPATVRDLGSQPITIQRQNVIVLTQSCDLAVRADGRCAVEDVILLPFYTRLELKDHKVYGKPQGWEEARKGRHAGYHVLNSCDLAGYELDFLLVDLRRIFTLSVGLVREIGKQQSPRIRLLPPISRTPFPGICTIFYARWTACRYRTLQVTKFQSNSNPAARTLTQVASRGKC